MTMMLSVLLSAASPLAGPSFPAPEASQGVAVDRAHVYVLDATRIGKYDKATGRRVGGWQADPGVPLTHMSGIAELDGKLYVTHTTSPKAPVTGSVEIFDARSMRHLRTVSFGVTAGALNWMVRYQGAWWACFAYYDNVKAIDPGRGTAFTQVVKLDDRFQRIEAWVIDPKLAAEKMAPSSVSGGGFGPDGRLYMASHDAPELYALEFPAAGAVLRWVDTIAVDTEGQGFDFDETRPGVVYGIKVKARQVTVTDLGNRLAGKGR